MSSSNPSRYNGSQSTVRCTQNGRCILLKRHAVSVFVPDGGLDDLDQADITVTVCEDDDHIQPPLDDTHTMLTPVLLIRSNDGQTLKRPAVVSMEHAAFLPSSSNGSPPSLDHWSVSCLLSEETPYQQAGTWTVATTIGKETLNNVVYCQMESRTVHFLVESFGRFVLIGEPKIRSKSTATKRTRILAFFGDCCLRVYCAADTRTAVNWVTNQERQLGGRLCSIGQETFNMQLFNDLYVRLEATSGDWRLVTAGCEQQIPAAHLRASSQPALHCSFALQPVDAAGPLELGAFKARLHVHQLSTNSAVVDVDVDAWWNVADCFGVFFPAIRLPQMIKYKLAALLDPPLDNANDWRMLAQLLRVDHYLPYYASRPSPTELILTLWESREPNVHGFVKLMHFLRRMRRPDACAVLSAYLNNNNNGHP